MSSKEKVVERRRRTLANKMGEKSKAKGHHIGGTIPKQAIKQGDEKEERDRIEAAEAMSALSSLVLLPSDIPTVSKPGVDIGQNGLNVSNTPSSQIGSYAINSSGNGGHVTKGHIQNSVPVSHLDGMLVHAGTNPVAVHPNIYHLARILTEAGVQFVTPVSTLPTSTIAPNVVPVSPVLVPSEHNVYRSPKIAQGQLLQVLNAQKKQTDVSVPVTTPRAVAPTASIPQVVTSMAQASALAPKPQPSTALPMSELLASLQAQGYKVQPSDLNARPQIVAQPVMKKTPMTQKPKDTPNVKSTTVDKKTLSILKQQLEKAKQLRKDVEAAEQEKKKEKENVESSLPLKKRRLIVGITDKSNTPIFSTHLDDRLTPPNDDVKDATKPLTTPLYSAVTEKVHVAERDKEEGDDIRLLPNLGVDPRNSLMVLSDIQLALKPDGDGDLPLHLAVVHENLEMVKKFVELMSVSGKSVDRYNKAQQTPLHLAVRVNFPAAVEVLLQSNPSADPNLVDKRGYTAVHLAVKLNHPECLQMLLTKSKFRHNLDYRNYDGLAPIHTAIEQGNVQMAKHLLSYGADVNRADGKSGRSAIFHAVDCGNQQLVDLLQEYNANIDQPNFAGVTPLMSAQARNLTDIATNLLKGIDVGSRGYVDERSPTPNQKLAIPRIQNKASFTVPVGYQSQPPSQPYAANASLTNGAPVAMETDESGSRTSPVDLSVSSSKQDALSAANKEVLSDANSAVQMAVKIAQAASLRNSEMDVCNSQIVPTSNSGTNVRIHVSSSVDSEASTDGSQPTGSDVHYQARRIGNEVIHVHIPSHTQGNVSEDNPAQTQDTECEPSQGLATGSDVIYTQGQFTESGDMYTQIQSTGSDVIYTQAQSTGSDAISFENNANRSSVIYSQAESTGSDKMPEDEGPHIIETSESQLNTSLSSAVKTSDISNNNITSSENDSCSASTVVVSETEQQNIAVKIKQEKIDYDEGDNFSKMEIDGSPVTDEKVTYDNELVEKVTAFHEMTFSTEDTGIDSNNSAVLYLKQGDKFIPVNVPLKYLYDPSKIKQDPMSIEKGNTSSSDVEVKSTTKVVSTGPQVSEYSALLDSSQENGILKSQTVREVSSEDKIVLEPVKKTERKEIEQIVSEVKKESIADDQDSCTQETLGNSKTGITVSDSQTAVSSSEAVQISQSATLTVQEENMGVQKASTKPDNEILMNESVLKRQLMSGVLSATPEHQSATKKTKLEGTKTSPAKGGKSKRVISISHIAKKDKPIPNLALMSYPPGPGPSITQKGDPKKMLAKQSGTVRHIPLSIPEGTLTQVSPAIKARLSQALQSPARKHGQNKVLTYEDGADKRLPNFTKATEPDPITAHVPLLIDESVDSEQHIENS